MKNSTKIILVDQLCHLDLCESDDLHLDAEGIEKCAEYVSAFVPPALDSLFSLDVYDTESTCREYYGLC